MLDFPAPGTLLVGTLLVLPGFVTTRVFELLVPRPRRDFSRSLVEFLGYSAFHYILFSWAIIPLLVRWHDLQWNNLSLGWVDYGLTVLLTIALPTVWPILAVVLLRRGLAQRFRGLRTLDPTPWDYYFGLKKPCWVIARLRNGDSIAGFFGENSFASAYPEPQGLYLEAAHYLTPEGAIGDRVQGGAGVLIQGEDIHLLEFWETEEAA